MTSSLRAACACLLSFLAACAAPAPEPVAPVQTSKSIAAKPNTAPLPGAAASITVDELRHPRYQAILVAGDTAEPVFDNTLRYLGDVLGSAGVAVNGIAAFAASTEGAGPVRLASSGVASQAATASLIAKGIEGLPTGPGVACLVYLTSHGSPGEGVYLSARKEHLSARQLDRALAAACGDRPTVVVVSACYSGSFADPPMTRANRIILTAARRDKPSFGCAADGVMTVFDECVAGSIAGTATWREVYRRVRGCVATREAFLRVDPSEPQGYFGPLVGDLATPWAEATASNGLLAPQTGAIMFDGAGRFDPARVPVASGMDAARRAASLADYVRAPSPKAFVTTPEGLFFWLSRTPGGNETRQDVARRSLETCEWILGGGCVLYALDDLVVKRLPSGLAPLHPPVLVRNGRVDPARIAFVSDQQRSLIERYLAVPGPKALSVGPSTGTFSAVTAATLDEARARSLAKCGEVDRGCVVYAANDDVVLDYRRPGSP